MAERNVERGTATGASTRALRVELASAFRGRGLVIFLVGATVMAAAGAWAGTQVGFDELEIRAVRGPHLRVLPARAVKPASLSRDTAHLSRQG